MRYRLAIGAVILQVLVLAYMAGEREWILRTGRTVLLRTAPIDPNDPMRGDYARLDYDISRVPRKLLAGNLPTLLTETPDYRDNPDRRVYAQLQVGEGGVAELTALTDAKPSDGIFIRGHAKSSYSRRVQARYGIEALFMQQGTALKLENMRTRERPGVPLDIEVALGSSGTAVLKNYQWEPLGITVTFERSTAPPPRTEANSPSTVRPQQFITAVKVELKNYGPEDVAIVDLPDGGSFRLVPDERWQESHYRWVGETHTATPPQPAQVFVLKPGQTHNSRIDLTQSAWFVVNTTSTGDGKPIPMREVTDPWSASFRLEYAPPSKASVTGLPHAEQIRHGRLRSRAFNPTAGLD